MRIQHNIAALNSYRQLGNNNNTVGKNLEKLSSGYRINRAGDDAAGLAISEKMRAQITGLETAQKNANDGISLVQTAEGALTEVHSMLNRMVELAGQSANGTYQNEVDRENLQKEVVSLKSEIDRIADSTNFNGIKLLDGTMGSGKYKLNAGSLAIGSTVATNFVVTDIKGSSIDKDGLTFAFDVGALDANGTFTTAGASDVLNVKMTDKEGNVSVVNLKLTDIIKKADGTAMASNTAIAAGDNVVLDLSAVGIGKIDLTATAAGPTANDLLKGLDVAGFVAPSAGAAITTGTTGSSLRLQIGDTSDTFNQISVSVGDMHVKALQIDTVDISTQSGAADAVKKLKDAINSVSSTRGDLGAIQNRLEHTINNLSVTSENMTAAESRIRDVDMAKEMMTYTKNNILVQSSQAMLAQANQLPQGVLQLLR
ncbi:flagellin [Lacrimispora saccharolytica]|uniref:Flagellin n=1 Tax=Lacrimispora saccharolytica (strain ATCC 35040 / DSM 2544 / NRCC 2533 / WM1) TaxID=610130 RepID=D9RA36_LACSW|nr:flagellin [Lacrimispora saccharolytica]ADL06008.1 flagellin domain protein [[Clostridium] saccharolyticum WM1]QRV19866.1 flagellin [Lacrimispora saccharolytica]